MMTTPSDHPPERLPLPSGFARSAAWPVLHIDFPARVAQIFEFAPADYLGAAFLDQRALAMCHAQAKSPAARVRFDDELALTLALLRRGFPYTRSILVKPTSGVALLG
jgi:hypothetical protein